MTLTRYRRKRRFNRTPEPSGGRRSRGASGLTYVVQKHAARRLHYDFRLEWKGVLKSWAVPKGPSPNPAHKRLAVEVEDHPLDYAGFHGDIPQGEYGAGHVEIWDRGTWEPSGDVDAGLRRGRLEFTLHGERLKGSWLLLRTRTEERQPQWLLIKRRDAYATAQGVELAEVLPASLAPAKRGAARRARSGHPAVQLATLVEEAPTSATWFGELKLDGYRLLIHADGEQVEAWTRNDKDWSSRVPAILDAIRRLRLQDCWLDGELVAIDAEGRTDFQLLQHQLDEDVLPNLQWMAFDLLQVAGADMRDKPLRERRRLLQQALTGLRDSDPVRVLDYLEGDIKQLWRHVCDAKLEGLILKDPDSIYQAGRQRSWLKLKCRQEEEFVIGGFTRTASGRKTLSSVLLGKYDARGRFLYSGRAGTGFGSDRELDALRRRLDALRTDECPFTPRPARQGAETAYWVKPKIVARVRFAERTRDGLLRQPLFVAERKDQDATDIRTDSSDRMNETTKRKAARSARLTHPEKLLFPEDGITKAQLAEYYAMVREPLWEHLRQRPLSFVRATGDGKSFFQRHPGEGAQPLFVSLPAGEPGEPPYTRLKSIEAIDQLAQFGIVELHTWGSRAPQWRQADRIVFDLDPDPALDWDTVRTAALLVRELLQTLGLESLLKTTGGAGLHLVVPLSRRCSFEDAARFSRSGAQRLEGIFPERFTATRGAERRRGKIFIDWQRNQRGATTVAAWSPRLRKGAPVSMPIEWSELDGGDIRKAHFNLRSAPLRYADQGDVWQKAKIPAQSLTAKLRKAVEGEIVISGARARPVRSPRRGAGLRA